MFRLLVWIPTYLYTIAYTPLYVYDMYKFNTFSIQYTLDLLYKIIMF